jgi:hypothetical protein
MTLLRASYLTVGHRIYVFVDVIVSPYTQT